MVTAILALLGTLVKTGVSAARFLAIQFRVLFAQVALQLREWGVFAALRKAAIVALWASLFATGAASLHYLLSLVVDRVSGAIFSVLLPTTGPAQFLYYVAWEEGVCLETLLTLSLDFLAFRWVVMRVVRAFDYVANLRLRINHLALSWYHK